MNQASLQVLRAALNLLDQTEAKETNVRAQITEQIHANEWRVLQQTYNARQCVDAPAASAAPLVSTRQTNGLRRHVGGSDHAVNGTSTQCVLCLRFFAGPGDDCIELKAPHAPDASVVVCSPCVFYEMSRMAPPNHLVHGVATVYHK